MEDDLITTKEVGDYRIKVYYCRDSECPITNWGLFGSFFFEYSDTHRLHDECNWKTFFYDNKHDLRDVIDAIVMKHIEQKDIVKYLKKGEANGISFTYNRGGNVWELKHKTSLFNLGIVDRWKRESEELIAELEKLCGKKWVNPYKPEEERFVLTLTDEERSLIEERIKAGHYSSENIEKRRVEAHKAKMAAKRAEICERYDKKIRQAEAEKKIMLCVFDYGLSTDNVIYYSHTNTLSFNWNGYGEKITQEEFDDFVNKVDRSQLPEGIKFELK